MAEEKNIPRAVTEGRHFDVNVWCNHDELVDVEELKPNPRNPNYHPQKQVDILSRIIQEQGWRNPITISNQTGLIVKGHCRLLAAREMELFQCPVEYQDYEDELQEHADLVADNKVAELAKLDNELLADLLDEFKEGDIDETLSGYTISEIDELLKELDDVNSIDDEEEVDPEDQTAMVIIEVEARSWAKYSDGILLSVSDIQKKYNGIQYRVKE